MPVQPVMRPAGALLAGLLVAICACGTTSQPVANSSALPSKPPPTSVPSPSNPPVVTPFIGMDFIDRTHGWEASLAEPGLDVDVSRTMDGGATWSRPVNAAKFYLGDAPIPRFGVRFANPEDGWLFSQGLFATTDGGLTWKPTPVNSYVYDAAVLGSSVWALTDKGVFRSEAGSATWTLMPAAVASGLGPFQLVRVSTLVAFIAEQDQFNTRLYRTPDGGATWKQIAEPCRGYRMPFGTLDGVRLWMVCGSEPGAGEQQKSAYVSDDGGVHWTLRASNDGTAGTGSIPIIGYAKWLAVTGPNTAFMANDRGGLYRSVDGGRDWVATGIAEGEDFFTALQFADPAAGWVAAETSDVSLDGQVGLYRTTDGGATWRLLASMPGAIA